MPKNAKVKVLYIKDYLTADKTGVDLPVLELLCTVSLLSISGALQHLFDGIPSQELTVWRQVYVSSGCKHFLNYSLI